MKKLGYSNIKIYNGGIKDWNKKGFPLESIESLPDVESTFIDSDDLYDILKNYQTTTCYDSTGTPAVTLLDLRDGFHIPEEKNPQQIATTCPTITILLDHLLDPQVRKKNPKKIQSNNNY